MVGGISSSKGMLIQLPCSQHEKQVQAHECVDHIAMWRNLLQQLGLWSSGMTSS